MTIYYSQSTANVCINPNAISLNFYNGVSQFSRFHSNPLHEPCEANFPGGEFHYFIFFKLDEDTRKRLEPVQGREQRAARLVRRTLHSNERAGLVREERGVQ